MASISRWSPGEYLTDQAETSRLSFALVILNQPIADIDRFTRLWNNASLRVCADGGANHLYNLRIDDDIPIPDCITGDLDSLQSKVGNYYRSLGVPIVPDRSQYATDFTKSLNWIAKQEVLHDQSGEDVSDDDDDTDEQIRRPPYNWVDKEEDVPAWAKDIPLDVVAYGATGGRVDQVFHAIDQLFRASHQAGEGHDDSQNTSSSPSSCAFPRKVTLVSDESVTFLLERGKNIIETPLRLFGKTCGLIPVAGASVISTEGLEWDLNETETRFGAMVSTSNHLVRDQVEVVTTELLLFTMEIRKAKTVPEYMLI